MNLKEIAIKNLLRRKAKSAFILAGLVTGIATVVSVISFTEAMTENINNKLEKYGANILAIPKTDNLSLTYGGISLGGVSYKMEEIRLSDLAEIKKIKNAANVAAVGPLVLGTAEIDGRQVLIAGADFKVSHVLRPWWQMTGSFPDNDGIVFGSEAAKLLKAGVGEYREVNGRSFEISGILKPTGSQDDDLVFTKIETAQSLLGKEGKVSMVEVAALCNACPIDEMVNQISDVLPGARVMAIQQVVKGRMETLNRFKNFSYGICAVMLLVGSLVVLVTMMGSVRERTSEIGILRAIGFRKSHIMKIILMEVGVISAIAGLVGYAVGLGGTMAVFKFFFNKDILMPASIELFAGSTVIAFIIGIVAGVYPALMAARLDPNDALRAL